MMSILERYYPKILTEAENCDFASILEEVCVDIGAEITFG